MGMDNDYLLLTGALWVFDDFSRSDCDSFAADIMSGKETGLCLGDFYEGKK